MIYIKSELSKILGKIEDLGRSSPLNYDHLYPLIEEAYLLISDYFEIDQCHSIIHQLAGQMKVLEKCSSQSGKIKEDLEHTLGNAQKIASEELRVFISHL